MPTYEYACRACGEHREVVQSFSDAALTTCESCGGDLRKVFSAAGLIFKGSGWHVKDYAGSSRPEAASTSASSSDSTGPASAASAAPTAPTPASSPAASPSTASD